MRMYKYGIVIVAFLTPNMQAQSVRMLDVSAPRPLAFAADELQKRHGMLINYEEPASNYAGDFIDRRPDYASGSRHIIFPKTGHIEVEYIASNDKTAAVENPERLLRDLLADHAKRGNSGVFRVEEKKGIFHIIPAQARDEKGIFRDIRPIMDTLISFPEMDRTIADTIQEICRAISRQTSYKVVLASYPLNEFNQKHSSRGSANQSARDALLDVLRDTQRSFVWRLNYSNPGVFVLNIKLAFMEVINIRGGKVAREIPFPVKK